MTKTDAPGTAQGSALARIQIVTVAFNSTGVIGAMLASVPAGVPVVIVDNASRDAEVLAELAARTGARVVTNDTNRGFGAACNIGAALGDSDFLFFVNPDARIEPGCVEALARAAATRPEAAAFSPRVLDGKGRRAFRRRSRLLPAALHWRGAPPDADAEIPLLNGAAIFVPRAHFDAVGGFDEAIFLYHEDDDLSLRLAAQIGPLMHVEDAVVTHAEGRSSARTPATAAFKAYHMARSAIYAMRKHGQRHATGRIILSALAQLASPLVWLSARKRAKQLAFLRGALSMRNTGATGHAS